MIGLCDYIKFANDRYIEMVKLHENTKPKYSIIKIGEKIANHYNCNKIDERKKNFIKQAIAQEKEELLNMKPLHGQFQRELKKTYVDQKLTNGWLKSAGLKGETESLIIAAQDQALNTRYHKKIILKQNIDSKCRICNQQDETISHIISGCTVLAPKEYTERHNKVASYIHWMMCKKLKIDTSDKWYEHKPEKVIKNEKITILYDMPIITDRKIAANRPDIVYHDKSNKVCFLIDVSVPDDSNIAKKEIEKMSKYKDLEIEIQRMWSTKAKIIPIVIGALGMIKFGMKKYLDMIPGDVKIEQIQKITLMGTAHIIRKVLNSEK